MFPYVLSETFSQRELVSIILKEISHEKADTDTSLRDICLSSSNQILDAGFTKALVTLQIEHKVDLMRVIMLHYAVLRSKSALDQFSEGLSTLGVLGSIRQNPNI